MERIEIRSQERLAWLQSKADYDLADWKAVKGAAECAKLGGSDKAGMGKNPKAPKA